MAKKECGCKDEVYAEGKCQLIEDYDPISEATRKAYDTAANHTAENHGLVSLTYDFDRHGDFRKTELVIAALPYEIVASTNVGEYKGTLIAAVPHPAPKDSSFGTVAVKYSIVHDTDESHSAKVCTSVIDAEHVEGVISALGRMISGDIQYAYSQTVAQINKG